MPLPPVVAFAAPSGTGKSTAIERLVRWFSERGVRVGVLKHDAHRLSFDKPGKDTWRFRQAGATRAVIAGAHEVACFSAPTTAEPTVEDLVRTWLPDVDLVLAEGYRHAGLPCVRIARTDGPSLEGWAAPDHVIAWFSDAAPADDLPWFALGDVDAQGAFLAARFLPKRRL